MAATAGPFSESEIRQFRAQQRRLLRVMLAVGRLQQREAGLGSLELQVLQMMDEKERAGLSKPIARDLAEEMVVDKAAMSRAVANLIKAALVGTQPDPRDGRRQGLSMTKEGRSMAQRMDLEAQEANRDMLEGVTVGERLVLAEGMELYLGLIEEALRKAPGKVSASANG